MKLVIPPLEEQESISIYLEKETQRLEHLKINLTQQINTLDAYKKSLIYECVTGKKRIAINEREIDMALA